MTEEPTLDEIKKLAYDIATQKKKIEDNLKFCMNHREAIRQSSNNPLLVELADWNVKQAENNIAEICTIESRMEQILRRITP